MTRYLQGDPRLADPIGRLAYIKFSMAYDADRIASALEGFAKRETDARANATYRRLSTICRDFHTHVLQAFSTTSPEMAKAISSY